MTDTPDLDALAALAGDATAGPWYVMNGPDGRPSGITAWERGAGPYMLIGYSEPDASVVRPDEGDAAFIAAARNALPALIERVKTAEADRDAYRARIDKVRALIPDDNWCWTIGDERAISLADLRAALDGDA